MHFTIPKSAMNTSTSELTAIFLPLNQVGFGSQFALGDLLIKSEIAYKVFSSATLNNFAPLNQLDHLQVALGVENTLYHPNNLESTFLIEFQTIEAVTKTERATLGLFQQDLFFGYRLNFNNTQSTEFFASMILDTERYYEILFNMSISSKIFDRIIADFGIVKCMAKPQGDGLGLLNLSNLDHTFFKLSYPL